MRIQSLIPLLVAGILVVVGYIAWVIAVKRRSQKLREKFPLKILALDKNVTDRYNRQWTKIQTNVGNDPSQSIEEANRLIKEVMIARGFPVANYEQDTEYLSVMGPRFRSNFRRANNIALKNQRKEISTKELSQAIVCYLSLFEELLGAGEENEVKVSKKEVSTE